MRKLFYCLAVLLLFAKMSAAQVDSIRQRIFLIGDGGELVGDTHPVIDWLKKNVDWNDEKNTAIFLGDNIYPLGLHNEGEASYPHDKKVLDYQLSLVKGKKGKALFVLGNHDWKNGKMGGWQQATNQINYINSLQQSNIEAWPREGCPGPVQIDLDEKVVAVLVDSQWFLYVHDKPGPGSGCDAKTIDEFTTQLKEIIDMNRDKLLILAMHHPIYSVGVHGGAYTLKHHIFPLAEAVKGLYIPLPIIGSIYPLARGFFGNIQDVNHPQYRLMAQEIENMLKTHPNAIAVAGHDHSLQLLIKDSVSYIVSGSAAELTRVRKGNKNLLFADVSYGFSVIEVRKSGKVETKFYNLRSPDYNTPIFARELTPIAPSLPLSVAVDTMQPLPKDTVLAANTKLEGGFLKNLFMGRNYRQEWIQPVRVPVLDLGMEMGGLTPTRKGGGKQTKSLRLTDKNGKEWALRSIEKFPEAAMPADLRRTVARDIVEQGISASYPYASLSIEPMANAAGVPRIRRKLVYVPDDPRLTRFRSDFANTMAILEEREPVGVKNARGTDDLVLLLAKDNDDHVDQRAVLKARLVDNFIMDFDRHEDQWQWATYDTGKGKMYYPIPRDHDQAFFTNQGLLPYFARKPWFLPGIQGFHADALNINTFNYAARNFDRFFINELSRDEWSRQVDTFLMKMTDDVIEASLQRQPKEIQSYSMQNIINTLKKRREFFKNNMMQYYDFISRGVEVVGTNQREQFTITKNDDGTVHLLENKIEKSGVVSSRIYERIFDPAITKEIRIYGLADDDRFIIRGGNSPIRIRVIGGPGVDEFINEGNGGTVLVYDAKFENNKVSGNPGLNDEISNDPQVNSYNRLNYKYNLFIPGLSVAYNIDDGLYLGARVEAIRQGFRKEPYARRHLFVANHALLTSSYRFRYEGDYIKAIGNHDLLLRADIRAPINVTNFFGIGNNTILNKNIPNFRDYYRARYDIIDASLLMRRQLQSWMRVYYGPAFQYFQLDSKQNDGKFVNNTRINGLDSASLYNTHTYAGAHLRLDIDSRFNKIIPNRGLVLDANVRPLIGLGEKSRSLTQLNLDMRIFMSIASRPGIVLATRFGVGHNIGHFEFQQAQYLSGVDNLRGYRRSRFAGRTMAYNNLELRARLFNFNTYLFPGSFGLFVFNDVGRVWADNENSTDWHVGNGGGIWFSPVQRFVISAALTRSKEEKMLPLVTFGFQF